MNIRAQLGVKQMGFAAAAALAIGAAGALPAHHALADQPALPSATVVNGTLFVAGTHDADAITIGVAADPSQFLVHFGNVTAPQTFDRAGFDAVSVALGDGNDQFSVDSQGQFSNIPLTVTGGEGNDRISGSQGVDVLIGGEGADDIRGGDGNDLIFGGAGDDDVDGERGADTEILGAGTDTALWVPGEGSDIVDGGGGRDSLTFIGAAGNESFALFANGARSVLTRDLGGIRMDLDSVEQVDLATLAGTDQVAVGDLSGTDLRAVNLDLSSAGTVDGQLDVVSVAGTDRPDHVTVATDGSGLDVTGLHAQTHISGNDTRDQLHLSTGAGNDVVDVTDAAAAAISVAVDLGADQH